MKSASSAASTKLHAAPTDHVNTAVGSPSVDKENSPPSISNSPHPRNKGKLKSGQDAKVEGKHLHLLESAMKPTENSFAPFTSKIDNLEQKLTKLVALKEDTMTELSEIIFELNELVPMLNQLFPASATKSSDEDETSESANTSKDKESGLARLLSRLNHLQQEYQKRRSVSEKRYNFRVEAIKERFNAEIVHNKTESESEIAENAVALIHKLMTKNQSNPLALAKISPESASSSSASIIAARKRSLPAINLPTSACPPAMKMARRQSVAVYPPNQINTAKDSSSAFPHNFNLNPSILMSHKSVADADLLAIKSRISNALKR